MREPGWRELLLEDFRYDRFANGEWLGPVVEHGDERERRILGHILAASKIWVLRLAGSSLAAMPEIPLSTASLDEIGSSWSLAIEQMEFTALVAYKNTKGEAGERMAGEIARHVLNHGTYHRGQLRESFGNRGIDFPETDFILYTYLRDEDSMSR